jgi:hypothetical protein
MDRYEAVLSVILGLVLGICIVVVSSGPGILSPGRWYTKYTEVGSADLATDTAKLLKESTAPSPSPVPTLTATPSPMPTLTATPSPIPTVTAFATIQTPTVTPTFFITSTPTPHTVFTAAAMSLTATAQAIQMGTPTSLPANAVTPIVVTSTPTPESEATVDLTVYLRGTDNAQGFATFSGEHMDAGTIYAEGGYVYGDVAVRIGDTVYHFDKPEPAPGEPEQLPAPYRLEFEFANSLVAATEGQPGFNPQKAQFWVGELDCNSAAPPGGPYGIEMTLYAGEEIRKHSAVSFFVADDPFCGVGGEEPEGGGGGGEEPPERS